MKFRILHGRHSQAGPPDEKGNPTTTEHVHNDPSSNVFDGGVYGPDHKIAGEEIDLCKRFNVPGMSPKFAYAEGPGEGQTPIKQKIVILDKMTDEELVEFAEGQEIDLGGVTERADIMQLIKDATA